MDEAKTPIWGKKAEDLTVSDNLKIMVLAPVIVTAAWIVPLAVVGKISEIRTARKLRKQAHLTVVPTDEEK